MHGWGCEIATLLSWAAEQLLLLLLQYIYTCSALGRSEQLLLYVLWSINIV